MNPMLPNFSDTLNIGYIDRFSRGSSLIEEKDMGKKSFSQTESHHREYKKNRNGFPHEQEIIALGRCSRDRKEFTCVALSERSLGQ